MDTILSKLDQFLAALETAVADGSFVRLSLRMPFGADETLKSIDIKPVIIRDEVKLSFTLHHQTRDLVQNHPQARAAAASNPQAYPGMLEWLGQLGDPEVDAALARRQG